MTPEKATIKLLNLCTSPGRETPQMVERARELIATDHANVNARYTSMTMLQWTALFNYEGIARVLLEHGADPNKWDQLGNTPLHEAARRGREGISRLLLEYGANPDIENWSGYRPRDCVCAGIHAPTRRLVEDVLVEMAKEGHWPLKAVKKPIRPAENPETAADGNWLSRLLSGYSSDELRGRG